MKIRVRGRRSNLRLYINGVFTPGWPFNENTRGYPGNNRNKCRAACVECNGYGSRGDGDTCVCGGAGFSDKEYVIRTDAGNRRRMVIYETAKGNTVEYYLYSFKREFHYFTGLNFHDCFLLNRRGSKMYMTISPSAPAYVNDEYVIIAVIADALALEPKLIS